jgi:hypothetical protein
MVSIFQVWPHQWFGCFARSAEETTILPAYTDYVDQAWEPTDKCQILNYLREGAVCITSAAPPMPCEICGSELHDLATWRWDGYWLWPNDLAHHVEFHFLRLPDPMIRTIREWMYRPPSVEECDVEQGKVVMKELMTILTRQH